MSVLNGVPCLVVQSPWAPNNMVKVFQVSGYCLFAWSGCCCLALDVRSCCSWRCTSGAGGWLLQLHSPHWEVTGTSSACPSVSKVLQVFGAEAVYCFLFCIPSGASLLSSVPGIPSIQSLMSGLLIFSWHLSSVMWSGSGTDILSGILCLTKPWG